MKPTNHDLMTLTATYRNDCLYVYMTRPHSPFPKTSIAVGSGNQAEKSVLSMKIPQTCS